MDPTMVILVAFYILLTHICSALCLMPQGQIRGSNAFSLDRELQFRGRHEINISLSECWHTTHTINTTISATSLQNRSRKHILYKSISHSEIKMPTNSAIPVSSTFAISGDVPEVIDSAFSSNGEEEPIVHAPPHLPPTPHPHRKEAPNQDATGGRTQGQQGTQDQVCRGEGGKKDVSPVLQKTNSYLLFSLWGCQFITRLHYIVHKQWIYRSTYLHYRGKDGLSIPEHQEIMNRVEEQADTDPDTLLPRHRHLLGEDFEALGSRQTLDRLLWLASMELATQR
jgi:hypothetical protein